MDDNWLQLPEEACFDVQVLVNDGKRLLFLTSDESLAAEVVDGKLAWGAAPDFPSLPESCSDSVWSNGVVIVSSPDSQKIFELKEGAEEALVLAGSGDNGMEDGIGQKASFSSPTGLELDGEGNLLILDSKAVRSMNLETNEVSTIFRLDDIEKPHGYKWDHNCIGYREGNVLLLLHPLDEDEDDDEEETAQQAGEDDEEDGSNGEEAEDERSFRLVTVSRQGQVLHTTAPFKYEEDYDEVWEFVPNSLTMDENREVAYVSILDVEACNSMDTVFAIPPFSEAEEMPISADDQLTMPSFLTPHPDGSCFVMINTGTTLAYCSKLEQPSAPKAAISGD